MPRVEMVKCRRCGQANVASDARQCPRCGSVSFRPPKECRVEIDFTVKECVGSDVFGLGETYEEYGDYTIRDHPGTEQFLQGGYLFITQRRQQGTEAGLLHEGLYDRGVIRRANYGANNRYSFGTGAICMLHQADPVTSKGWHPLHEGNGMFTFATDGSDIQTDLRIEPISVQNGEEKIECIHGASAPLIIKRFLKRIDVIISIQPAKEARTVPDYSIEKKLFRRPRLLTRKKEIPVYRFSIDEIVRWDAKGNRI